MEKHNAFVAAIEAEMDRQHREMVRQLLWYEHARWGYKVPDADVNARIAELQAKHGDDRWKHT